MRCAPAQGEITVMQPTASGKIAQIRLSLMAVSVRQGDWLIVKLTMSPHCFQPLDAIHYFSVRDLNGSPVLELYSVCGREHPPGVVQFREWSN